MIALAVALLAAAQPPAAGKTRRDRIPRHSEASYREVLPRAGHLFALKIDPAPGRRHRSTLV